MNLQVICSQLPDIDSRYKQFTKKWIAYATNEVKAANIPEKDWEAFFTRTNPVAGIDRGEMLDVYKSANGEKRVNERKSIIQSWDDNLCLIFKEIANPTADDRLQKIKDAKEKILKIILSGNGRNMNVAINRMLISFCPDILIPIPNEKNTSEFLSVLQSNIESGNSLESSDNWVDNSYNITRFLKEKLGNLWGRKSIWGLYEYLKKNKEKTEEQQNHTKMEPTYRNYIDLLEANKNLILTGAPGTGKTYMAKEIAKEMQAECEFVQFHPSYDYTDFVEGLRPIQSVSGGVGFERKDGVFKEFCKRAAKNLQDSKKSKQELTIEKTLEDQYNELIEKIENDEIDKFPLKSGGKYMEVVKISDFNNIILKTPGTLSDRTYTVSFARIAKLAKVFPDTKSLNSIANINDSIRDAIGGCNSSSYWAVLNEVYKQGIISPKVNDVVVKKKPYVFIIDEINRGEISKIFGELFFSVDPGYRGEKGRVNTQYQNLINDEDVFKEGFYVPENVYIIGTMNDIDRSVESMDFAMRRRFAWSEVTADESMKMLDSLDNISSAELLSLKNRMFNLNNAIAETDGLNEAYQIGGAYFLKYAKYHDFDLLWKNHLKGLLGEYLRGNRNSKGLLEDLYTAYCNDTIDEESTDIEG